MPACNISQVVSLVLKLMSAVMSTADAADATATAASVPDGAENPLPTEEVELTEDELREAYELNARLRSMLIEAEEQEQQRQRQAVAAAPAERQPPGARTQTHKGGGWGGTTHTKDQAARIDRENAILVDKLTSIAQPRTQSLAPTRAAASVKPKKSSAGINRAKMNDQIARENAVRASLSLMMCLRIHCSRSVRHASSFASRQITASVLDASASLPPAFACRHWRSDSLERVERSQLQSKSRTLQSTINTKGCLLNRRVSGTPLQAVK
eukprot:6181070-Pleurochrysis_carterae.AAC.4